MAAFIQNGQLEIIIVTEDLYDVVIEYHKEYFLKYENLSIACDLMQSEEVIMEVETRLRVALQGGLTFAVRQKETDKLVAVCINNFLPCAPRAAYQCGCLVRLGESLSCLNAFDILKEWNIDCAMEMRYLSTRPDFAGYGLASILAKHAVAFARKMLENALPADEISIPRTIMDLKPKAVFAVFTSLYSQKIGEKLGMETQLKISFADLIYEGKSFASKIEPVHKYLTIAAMRL